MLTSENTRRLPYLGRKFALATKHGKERAIARPMRYASGLELVLPAGLDTDALGTFTGEVPREGKPLDVCLKKARLGMAATGLPLGLASEGSFGPHPFLPFVPSNLEIMAFVDDDLGFAVHEMLFSEKTNYAQREVCEFEELGDWLQEVRFPSHGLIVRPKSSQPRIAVEKGIVTLESLRAAIERAVYDSEEATALVETDMRAHLNPTRMTLIRRLSFKLARRLATLCPACAAPGWGMSGHTTGLPCEECETPTEMILWEIFTCTACDHRETRPRLDGLQKAPAGRCGYCNP